MKMKSFFILLFILVNTSRELCAKPQDTYVPVNDIKDIEILKNIHAATCDGDTTAYIRLMQQIPYYDFFVYSIYMASKYDYAPAYYNAYRIYNRWLNLYNQIDTTSRNNLRFWLQWGADAGSTVCEQVLRDSTSIDDSTYTALDSLNNFVFVVPQTGNSSDSIKATLAGERNISISKEQLEKYKMQRLCCNDSASKSILETYAYNNKYVLEKYTICNADVFPVNENFLFRVHERLKYGNCEHITFGILWHLSKTYMACDDYNSTFSNKLGLYLLRLGYEAGDKYAVIPLAQLYAQGLYVPQDLEYAKKVLTSSMPKYKAEKLIQIWINEIK